MVIDSQASLSVVGEAGNGAEGLRVVREVKARTSSSWTSGCRSMDGLTATAQRALRRGWADFVV